MTRASAINHPAELNTSTARARMSWCGMLAALGLLLAGCATEVGNHTFLKQAYPAKAATHSVDVYTNGLPTRAFERVAILDAHCEAQGWMTPNLQNDALPVLLKEARAAGCDGIDRAGGRFAGAPARSSCIPPGRGSAGPAWPAWRTS